MLGEFVRRAPPELRPLSEWREERLCVASGHPAALVLERARTTAADLLLLGPHRPRPGIDFGNTMRGLLSRADCPVWIQPVPARAIRRILVPTDLSAHAAHALALARALARRIDAKLTVVHVFEPPILGAGEAYVPGPVYAIEDLEREALRAFEEEVHRLDPEGGEIASEFVRGNTVALILGLQERFDLVVMGSHGHTGFAAALLGSVTHAVARSIRSALLVVPDPRRSFLH